MPRFLCQEDYLAHDCSVQDLDSPIPGSQPSRGRIAIYCVAESLDREGLITALQKRGSRFLLHRYPDVLYGQYSSAAEQPQGDVFYFDYGCVAFWGLTLKQVCCKPPCMKRPASLDIHIHKVSKSRITYAALAYTYSQQDIFKRETPACSLQLSMSIVLWSCCYQLAFIQRVLC